MVVGRIRVLVAGDIYVNPSLVRPFLEDDGYEVVADGLERAAVLPAVSGLQPDAVVIDDRLLSGRRNGKLLGKVRRAAPDAKVVLVTAGTERVGSDGVDASLEKGTSLAALSLVLGRLFAEVDPHPALTAAGVGATAGATRMTSTTDRRGAATRFVVAVGAPLLVVWALIAMLATGGPSLPPGDTTDLAEPVFVPQGTGPLEYAQSSLDRMLDAIEAGNYPLATAYARDLMEQRDIAIAGGYLTARFDDQIQLALARVAGSLPGYAIVNLQDILGAMFPVLEDERTPGGGSGIILGPSVGAGTGTGTGTGESVTGESVTGGGDGETIGGGEDDGDGGPEVALGPGDGREWGQSHKQTKGQGGPPPWAHGNTGQGHGHRGDPPGHHADHGNGHGNGGGAGA